MTTMYRFLIGVLLVLFRCGCLPVLVDGERTLQLVNLVYRHGDRTPVSIYPSDPYQSSTWPEGMGQLTTMGMEMHYNLGQWLRQRYITTGFLNATYNLASLHVRSTDKDRTLMSAEADLAGLYPPEGDQVWKKGFDWMPIPVHTVPLEQDYLLRMNGPPCPVYDDLKEKTRETAEYKDVESKYKDFMADLTVNSNSSEPLDVLNIYKVEDPLFVERLHGLAWPEWTNTTDFYKTLKYLSDVGMNFLFNSKEKSKLKGGVLLGNITENMVNKSTTSDPTDLRKKIFMYSAHDTTLAALMSTLDIYNGIQPPLASCVGVELWQENKGQYTVNMWFRNDTTKAPYPLALDECSSPCLLEKFISLTKDMVPDDIQKECGVVIPNCISNISLTVLITVVIGLLATIVITLLGLVICRCRQGRSKDGHMRLPTEDSTA